MICAIQESEISLLYIYPLTISTKVGCASVLRCLRGFFLFEADMLSLLNTIYSQFTSDSTLTSAFPGGLHRDQAPEGTAMPYLVSKVVSSQTHQTYANASRSFTQIRFSAFGIGHDATGILAQTLISRLDFALLTLPSGANDSILRLDEPTPVLHAHDGQGNDVWEWGVTYEYAV